MKKKYSFQLLSLVLIVGLILSACSSKSSSGGAKEKADTSKFPLEVKNSKTAIKGGTLTYGLVTDTPFAGTLNAAFYSDNYDWQVMQFFDESLFSINDNYEITNDGAATYKLSNENKTMTVKIKDNVNWSDGKPVTAEDYKYAFEVIGNKDYTGVRYGDTLISGIEGMADYHAGKAKDISGIKILGDKELSITWKEANPSVLTGIWSTPLPKHIFKDIPIKKMASSDAVRKHPIGFGPFVVNKIVPGESVEFVANKNYYKGAPQLEKVILKVVNPKVVAKSLKNGDIDVAQFPTDKYSSYKNPKNFQYAGANELAYTYIGFKLGKWDAKKGENVMDPNAKMANKDLRKAMGYAIDNDAVGEKFYNGLRSNANTLIPPSFPTYHNDSIKGYSYDKKKAEKLLDDAGYKDVDKDGYREDPNGKKLVINFASMSGGDTAEPLANYYIQSWKDVGLNVKLTNGRLIELNSFYDKVEKDDKNIDIYQAAWGTGTDPDPYGLYGRDVQFDYSRYTSEENDKLLAEGHGVKAFDTKYRKDIYDKWQQLMVDDAPVIPTLYRYTLFAANNRVKNFKAIEALQDWSKVAVTADKPEVDN